MVLATRSGTETATAPPRILPPRPPAPLVPSTRIPPAARPAVSPRQPQTQRDPFLDVIRGVATVRVVLWHMYGFAILSYMFAAIPAMFFVSGSLFGLVAAPPPAEDRRARPVPPRADPAVALRGGGVGLMVWVAGSDGLGDPVGAGRAVGVPAPRPARSRRDRRMDGLAVVVPPHAHVDPPAVAAHPPGARSFRRPRPRRRTARRARVRLGGTPERAAPRRVAPPLVVRRRARALRHVLHARARALPHEVPGHHDAALGGPRRVVRGARRRVADHAARARRHRQQLPAAAPPRRRDMALGGLRVPRPDHTLRSPPGARAGRRRPEPALVHDLPLAHARDLRRARVPRGRTAPRCRGSTTSSTRCSSCSASSPSPRWSDGSRTSRRGAGPRSRRSRCRRGTP